MQENISLPSALQFNDYSFRNEIEQTECSFKQQTDKTYVFRVYTWWC